MKMIPLYGPGSQGRAALVDDEDYPLLSRHVWVAKNKRSASGLVYGPYAYARIGTREIAMHMLITGYRQTDHQNRNPLDNQKHNLRPATSKQNMANRPPQTELASTRYRGGKTSRYKGVSRGRSLMTPWRSQIYVDGVYRHLGSFAGEDEAARAYDTAAREAWGEFAYQNFPGAS